jgi:hypothetical protein
MMDDLIPYFDVDSDESSGDDNWEKVKDDGGVTDFRRGARDSADGPRMPSADARRRISFNSSVPTGSMPALPEPAPVPEHTNVSTVQQQEHLRKRMREIKKTSMTSAEVHATLQRHWVRMKEAQQPFLHVDVRALSPVAQMRHQRLVNTSAWISGGDEHGPNPNDVLLPESLVSAAVPDDGGAERKTLKPHQVSGIRFMWRLLMETPHEEVPAVGCILAHSMGLGKTCQVIVFVHIFIAAMKRLYAPPEGRRADGSAPTVSVAMVVPKSTRGGWEAETARWSTFFPLSERIELIHIDESQSRETRLARLAGWKERGGVLLVGYEGLTSLVMRGTDGAGALEHIETDLLVCDEAHRLKSSDLLAVKALHKLHARRRLLLTGTPMQNHLLEYWAMVDFCLPRYFDRKTFMRYFVRPIAQSLSGSATPKDVSRAKQLTFTLVREMECFVQRVDSAPLRSELPQLREYLVIVPLSKLQSHLYGAFLDILRKSKGDQFNVLQAFAYASKICAHPILLFDALSSREDAADSEGVGALPVAHKYMGLAQLKPEKYVAHPQDGHKLLLAIEIILNAVERGEKTLVFSMSTKLLDYFERLLARVTSERFRDADFVKYLRIDGSTSGQERASMIKAFERGCGGAVSGDGTRDATNYSLFLISTRAGGVGITLTAATRIILLDTSFNPADDRQAIGRAYRYGQSKPVYAYRLVCENTIEHRIFDQKIAKEWLFQTVVDQQMVKRDAIVGTKLQQIFLLKDRQLGVAEGQNTPMVAERRNRQTARCCEEDSILAAVRAAIVSAVPHHSFLENDDEEYGEEEAAYYERYKKRGGLTAFTEDPVVTAKREADEAVQRELVIARGRTLTSVLEDIIVERAKTSSRVHQLLQEMGVAARDSREVGSPDLQRARYVSLNGRSLLIPPRPMHIDTFAASCRRCYAERSGSNHNNTDSAEVVEVSSEDEDIPFEQQKPSNTSRGTLAAAAADVGCANSRGPVAKTEEDFYVVDVDGDDAPPSS